MSRAPGSPTSLVAPTATTATGRRYLSDVLTGQENGAPTASQNGVSTYNKRFLHVTVHLKDDAASCSWRLWEWNDVSGLWCLDSRLGTAGTVALAGTDADNPQSSIIDIAGMDRVYLELDDILLSTTGIDVWLATSAPE